MEAAVPPTRLSLCPTLTHTGAASLSLTPHVLQHTRRTACVCMNECAYMHVFMCVCMYVGG